ncbi:GNAT family N-acetyltransferase [Sodalis ligni]|uniref:RimJ/RimL family protein N-acetyltransferase n=1 Tax=Sodalis ligni TaxID=2697027 RepID=A0A4R1NN96_9GAMM|nr:GNAT family N-acetyltransferase [Sodalis ligni]TCL06186.1 RimJ/RimL family protein N-acetyltransferase [Sodalis ligni]
MKITDFPVESLCNDSIRLIAPTMSRVEEMLILIGHFNELHHDFLLWASRENSLDDVRENMRAAIQDFANDSNEYKFLIISRESQKLLGCISLFIRNPQIPYYEIGYWLATDVLGKGLMTQACILVRNLALDVLKANRLEIRTAGKNIRSAAVALRCGFKREAVLSNERLDVHGRLDDTHIYLYATV